MLFNSLSDRRFTNAVRYFLDDWMPPVLRESRPLAKALALAFHGRHFDLDFKRKAPYLTEEEFSAAYARAAGRNTVYRLTDMTKPQIDWMVANTIGPEVLEVGCGYGVLGEHLAARGDLRVTATDLSADNVAVVQRRMAAAGLAIDLKVADVERLPFPDRSFDTTLTAHTLEHVRNFEEAVSELVRVTRKRLLIVVPCQRYYRYTIDYHLHFFPEPEQLIMRLGLPDHHCEKVTGDLCYRAELATETAVCAGVQRL